MGGFNTVIVGGNLVRDPRVRMVRDARGERIRTVFRLAVAGDAGAAVFVDVVLTGRQAEVVGQYARRGSAVVVDGRLAELARDVPGRGGRQVFVIAKRVEILDK